MKDRLEIVKESAHGTFKSYVIGFILSLILTLGAYFLVVNHVWNGWTLILAIVGLGLVQVCIQLFFFLHLGEEPKPYWNVLIFLFMLLVLVVIVSGSLWIIYNLDYRVMS